VVKFQVKADSVRLSHGHVEDTYKQGVTYSISPELWEAVFKPTELFELTKEAVKKEVVKNEQPKNA